MCQISAAFSISLSNICNSDRTIDFERRNRLLKVCYVPATSATFLAFFIAVAINSANEANKADVKQSILLRCLCICVMIRYVMLRTCDKKFR